MAVQKENKLFIGPKQFFLSFVSMKILFALSNCSNGEKLWKENLEKTILVVRWFDLANKIVALKLSLSRLHIIVHITSIIFGTNEKIPLSILVLWFYVKLRGLK